MQVLEVHNKYCELYAGDHTELAVLPKDTIDVNTRQKWQWIENSLIFSGSSIKLDHQDWVPTILQNIGKFLYHIIMHDLKIDVNSMKTNKPK